VNLRQKTRDLVELAVDERTPEKERLSAALKAVRLIHEHDLLASPLDILDGIDSDTVRAAKSVATALPDLKKNLQKVFEGVGGARRQRRRRRD